MRSGQTILISAILMLVTALPVLAGDVLTYQGRLTNASGTPVADGNHSLTFRIYPTLSGGSSVWSDQFSSVQTSDGLFSVPLGSQAALDLASLGDTTLYLEVQVGSDGPLSPRTLLTVAPKASSAGRLVGSVETGANLLKLKREDGESALEVNAVGNNGSLRMFAPQPEPPKEVLEIISMPSNGAKIRMFAPQPEPPRVLIEMAGDPTNGPSMGFFDDGSEVMGIGPSPFHSGMAMKWQAASDAHRLLELRADYGSSNSSALTMEGAVSTNTTIPLASMNAGGGTGGLRLGHGTDIANSGTLISATAGASESRVDIASAPIVGGATNSIAMIANSSYARLGIGTSSPTQALQVVGNICYTGTIGACSDARYKKDIKELDHALEAVLGMRGVQYRWKTDEYPLMQFSKDRQVGFVAQEVKKVLPEAVIQQPDGSYAVDYSRVTPLLLEAIKELSKQNAELTKRVKALEEERR
jgi:hypothetical protein